MNRLFAPTTSALRSKLLQEIRMSGHWLLLARVAWIVVALLGLVYFFSNIPGAYTRVQTICIKRTCPLIALTPTSLKELQALGIPVGFFAAYFMTVAIVSLVAWFTVGVVIFWHKSNDRMALFVALALVTFGVVATSISSPDTLAARNPLWWFVLSFLTFLGETSIFLFFYLFPDGRFVPRWTFLPAIVLMILFGCLIFFPSLPFSKWLISSSTAWLAGFLAIGLFAQLSRYWRVSSSTQRQQTKWVVFGLTVSVVGYEGTLLVLPLLGLPHVIFALVAVTCICVSLLLVPLSIGIAILRNRLWDINLIINRTMVYGALTACVIGIYVLVVGALSILFQSSSNLLISLLATGVVAVLFQPLRSRLQYAVNRLTYGERDDPYRVISRLGQRVERTLASEAVLPTIVETVAQALKLPYAAITVKQEETFTNAAYYSASGKPEDDSSELLRLPLVYQTEQVGELVLAPRAVGETFTAADQRLLQDLAHQIGVAVHAVQLTADLQRLTVDLQHSRERLVIAREEERRRLRRDLHDGIGPTLASLSQRLDTARRLVPRDPDAAVALLDALKGQVKATIADIRRVVYALRPPVLDEFGLVSALREHTAYAQGSNGLHISIEAPEDMPPLPAAVEVAAYRIVLEALTNVERHAHAHTCLVRLELPEAGVLCLDITDDGGGLSEYSRGGVGMTSMRERAAELGGECKITSDPMRGTRVWVRLPLTKE
jgi:signal transduction histidine kinase